MKSTARFIVFHPSLQPSGNGAWPGIPSHRAFLVLFLLFFMTFVLTLVSTRNAAADGGESSMVAARPGRQLPGAVFEALLEYVSAAANATDPGRMSAAELTAIAEVLSGCEAPCNFLVFGLTRETRLWNALNHGGRTVFIDESAYRVSKLEEENPHIEAFDVQFTTKVSELYDLIEHYKLQSKNECRPVQNLLFSDCRLAINDLPNHLYDVAWDVILIDGPRGYFAAAPGRMSAIYTAGVLARSKTGVSSDTHVFVHEIDREAERVCSEEFLCTDNLVGKMDKLGHFVLRRTKADTFDFCSGSDSDSGSGSDSSSRAEES